MELPVVVAFGSVVPVVPVPVAVELCDEPVPAAEPDVVCATARPIATNRIAVIRIPFFMLLL